MGSCKMTCIVGKQCRHLRVGVILCPGIIADSSPSQIKKVVLVK